tara:strand:+ start:2472 stop:2651 length:180 start_codon:yes stop_codon:yes gene_type:complete
MTSKETKTHTIVADYKADTVVVCNKKLLTCNVLTFEEVDIINGVKEAEYISNNLPINEK